jgi:glutaminyl-tRNA synthetase
MPEETQKQHLNFIEEIIDQDLEEGKHGGRIHTRFPPEPNGYLHIGHAKSICLNFGIADKYQGLCNLRFDDTNPEKEDVEYVESIQEDIKWLGFDWQDRLYFASDYFPRLFELAVELIKMGKAYVDDLTAEEISASRGTPTEPGKHSPFRDRTIGENLELFQKMKSGKFQEGSKVLRAKIDMSSPNMHLRDPIMYRIRHTDHHRTGKKWCIYPTYDWAHGQSDALEKITHSLCSLEFEVHRPLYNWFIEQLGLFPSKQYEFARLNIGYTIMSKRKLLKLVQDNVVQGWDDPRMPTISGMRRRGYTPGAIRKFCDRVGVARRDNVIDISLLEFSVREDLNLRAPRRFGILDPIKLVITNYPDDREEWLPAINNPENPDDGTRKIPFTRELYIERSDFMEDPPKKFFRLGPGREVRLKYGYIVKCEDYQKDPDSGQITTVFCTFDPQTKSGSDSSGKKVKGTLGWVSVRHALEAEIRLYDRLFLNEDPDGQEGKDFQDFINPDSLRIIEGKVECNFDQVGALDIFQFERQGYFNIDPDSQPGALVFNRTVTLRDNWAKQQKQK